MTVPAAPLPPLHTSELSHDLPDATESPPSPATPALTAPLGERWSSLRSSRAQPHPTGHTALAPSRGSRRPQPAGGRRPLVRRVSLTVPSVRRPTRASRPNLPSSENRSSTATAATSTAVASAIPATRACRGAPGTRALSPASGLASSSTQAWEMACPPHPVQSTAEMLMSSSATAEGCAQLVQTRPGRTSSELFSIPAGRPAPRSGGWAAW